MDTTIADLSDNQGSSASVFSKLDGLKLLQIALWNWQKGTHPAVSKFSPSLNGNDININNAFQKSLALGNKLRCFIRKNLPEGILTDYEFNKKFEYLT